MNFLISRFIIDKEDVLIISKILKYLHSASGYPAHPFNLALEHGSTKQLTIGTPGGQRPKFFVQINLI